MEERRRGRMRGTWLFPTLVRLRHPNEKCLAGVQIASMTASNEGRGEGGEGVRALRRGWAISITSTHSRAPRASLRCLTRIFVLLIICQMHLPSTGIHQSYICGMFLDLCLTVTTSIPCRHRVLPQRIDRTDGCDEERNTNGHQRPMKGKWYHTVWSAYEPQARDAIPS